MERINLNYDWKFSSEFSADHTAAMFDDTKFETVNIPHNIKDIPYNNFNERIYQIVACYRKHIAIDERLRGKALVLEFEAVGQFAEVYVNGKFAFAHKGGYTAFRGDISQLVEYGKDNIIAVKVDANEREEIPPFGNVIDYLCYGGIYREVYIYVHEKQYIQRVTVSPIDVLTAPKIEIDLTFNCQVAGEVEGLIVDHGGLTIAKFSIPVSGDSNVKHFESIMGATLWDIDNPYLYTLELKFNGENYTERFGVRQARFTSNGFFLNNKKIKIVGLNRHQSYPYVGYAMPESAQMADADYMKFDLGLNLARTSHYPNSKHFLNRCDEIGLLVFTEIPGWQYIGKGEEWRALCLQNVEDMIVEDFNHASIILWGVRINESNDDNELYKATNDLAHKLDKTRQTGGVRCMPQSKLLEDVYTYNDFNHRGDNAALMPKFIVCGNAPLLITEHNGHMFPTKTFDHEKKRQEHLLRHANVLNCSNKRDNTCGAIGWCMSDYNTHKDFGSGDKICYHGVSDMFRINKLAAYIYKAQQDKYPVLEVTSNMEIGDNAGGQVGNVYMITNCDTVKLYKNGVLINTFDIGKMKEKSKWKYLANPPVELSDIIGDQLEKNETYKFTRHAAERCKKFLLNVKKLGTFPAILKMPHTLLGLMIRYGLNIESITNLFGQYVTNWGDESISYKLEGSKNGQIAVVEKAVVNATVLEAKADSATLIEADTYDVTRIAVRALSQVGNVLPYCSEVIAITTTGPIKVIGDSVCALIGGQRGFWIKTIGRSGKASVTIESNVGSETIDFNVIKK